MNEYDVLDRGGWPFLVDWVDRIEVESEDIVFTHHGKPIAVMVPYEEYITMKAETNG